LVPSSRRPKRDPKNDALLGLHFPTAGYDRTLQIPDPPDAASANNVTAAENPLSDREHLVAFREGNREALERVYHDHVAAVIRFLRNGFMYTTNDKPSRFPGMRDSFELESLVQETFARAFDPRTRLAYDGLRPYGAFLNGIAKNLVLDRLRKQARHGEVLAEPDVLDAMAIEEPAIETNEDDKRARELVTGFLDKECDDRDRTLYTLRYERELSQVDAAAAAGLTRIQVRRWESKFRARLLRFLKRADYVRDR
jgi:RNA polymerase sigma factor (sigma-70 family)